MRYAAAQAAGSEVATVWRNKSCGLRRGVAPACPRMSPNVPGCPAFILPKRTHRISNVRFGMELQRRHEATKKHEGVLRMMSFLLLPSCSSCLLRALRVKFFSANVIDFVKTNPTPKFRTVPQAYMDWDACDMLRAVRD